MFTFETPFLDLEIYRLITILSSSPALAEVDESKSEKRKVEYLRQWEFPEVSRIVVSLAAIVRSSLDADPFQSEALERPVGTLFPDRSDLQRQEPLRFREACNKILHADHVDPETTATTKGTAEPLTGRLVLYGRLHNKEWRAELELRDYALSALSLSP